MGSLGLLARVLPIEPPLLLHKHIFLDLKLYKFECGYYENIFSFLPKIMFEISFVTGRIKTLLLRHKNDCFGACFGMLQ